MGLLSSPDLRTRSPSQGLKQASGAAEITVQPTTALNNSRLTSADIRGMGIAISSTCDDCWHGMYLDGTQALVHH